MQDIYEKIDKLKTYIYTEKPEYNKILVEKIQEILSRKILGAGVQIVGVVVNHETEHYNSDIKIDKLRIDGYVYLYKLGGHKSAEHIVELHISMESLVMTINVGVMHFEYYLDESDIDSLLQRFEEVEKRLKRDEGKT